MRDYDAAAEHFDEMNGAGAAGTWPRPLDLRKLAQIEPESPPMIVDDWLPAGYATLIAGHGGAGKSSIALHLAACIALGRDFFGFSPEPRRVLYLACEDRMRVLHWRLARICRYLRVDMAELAGQLEVLDLVGRDSILWERTAAGGRTTGAFNQLMAAAQGVDVIVVDGVADTYAGSENDRGDVKRYVNALVGLISPERGAVILIHHVNKPAAGTATSEGYSGSTGWHNSVRARWYLYPEIEQTEEGVERTGRLLLELQKSNLGRTDQSIAFRWDEAAHLFVAESMPQTSHIAEFSRDTDERDGIMAAFREVESRGDYVPAAMQGSRTAWHVLSAVGSFPETLKSKVATKRFRRQIEHLRHIRLIRESSIRRSNRTYVAILTLQPSQDVACTNAQHSFPDPPSDSCAGAACTNAQHSRGGIRGVVRCARCDGEGCAWCGAS